MLGLCVFSEIERRSELPEIQPIFGLMNAIPLQELLSDFPLQIFEGDIDSRLIHGIALDSRKVNPGDLFVATLGKQYDAHRFVPDAIRQGAAAVVGMEAGISVEVPYIRVEDSRQALGFLAAAYYGFPARKLVLIGVTGTDGKTTTCNMIFEILKEKGIRSGMVSTVNAFLGEEIVDTGFHVTTPDAPELQAYLARMVDHDLTHAIIETTSHGLAQHRVNGCEYDIAVVTNVTHEHLDEHGSYGDYLRAKARLFKSLLSTSMKVTGNPRLAVLNLDDASFDHFVTISPAGYKAYSTQGAADVVAHDVKLSAEGSCFNASGSDWDTHVRCHLPGRFNVSNCLAAITATVYGLGIEPKTAALGIENLTAIPGRMEPINLGQNFNAVVDFAHTPNALRNAIATVKDFTSGRVICVFGSAGLRDREKRRMMAEVSAAEADLTIFTAEDPRTESLDDILSEMAEGAAAKGSVECIHFWRIPDRREALRFGVNLAEKGDTVLACGKGHEQSMCFGDIEYPWDDRTAMRAALSERLGIHGPEMPWLQPDLFDRKSDQICG
jgi:UDP-N-acetylmuramoyl-L-alanyl-D-glutamate--2,6-diaminopimelate ligase